VLLGYRLIVWVRDRKRKAIGNRAAQPTVSAG